MSTPMVPLRYAFRVLPVLTLLGSLLGLGLPVGRGLPAPAGSAVHGRWEWPLSPVPVVVARFDPPPDPWSAGHRGVDLLAAVGQSVLAPESGSVSFAGMVAGRPVVVVTHPGGLRSTFEPVAALVPVGTPLAAGSAVGTVSPASGHCAPATCMHWGVIRGNTYLDPLAFVAQRRVVLLPLHPSLPQRTG